MRVLHVIASLVEKQGGPSAALAGLALAQRRIGLDVAVATGDNDALASRAEDLKAAGIDVIGLPQPSWRARLTTRPSPRLEAAVRACDVIHIHGVWEHLLFEAAIAAGSSDKPYVIRGCGMLDEWALRRKPFKKRLYLAWRLASMLRRAAAVHCTTRMEADSTGQLRIRFRRVIVEPNGVTTAEFAPLPARGGFRAAHGIGDRPLVVFLGRVHPGKGVEYLLPALPLVRTPDVVVAIVGPDSSPFAAEMKRRAESVAPAVRVIFTGMLRGHDRVAPLVDADVFALPSEHENFGVSVIEALAAGSPVVVSDHVGLAREVVSQGVGSATSLTPTAIAAALDDWLARRNSIPRPFRAARTYALESFDWDHIAARWRAHYDKLAA